MVAVVLERLWCGAGSAALLVIVVAIELCGDDGEGRAANKRRLTAALLLLLPRYVVGNISDDEC